MLLCCSEASLQSSWVEDEVAAAVELERDQKKLILVPLVLDDYLFEHYQGRFGPKLRERKAADFRGWERDNKIFEREFERVVEALRTGDTQQP